MTDRQFRSLLRYIRKVADRMALKDWDIRLSSVPCEDPNHVATVECVFGRKLATIQVAKDFMHYSPEEQRHVITHELTHIHIDPAWTLLDETLPEMVGIPTWKTLSAGFRQQAEHAVDAIATAVAPSMPLWDR